MLQLISHRPTLLGEIAENPLSLAKLRTKRTHGRRSGRDGSIGSSRGVGIIVVIVAVAVAAAAAAIVVGVVVQYCTSYL